MDLTPASTTKRTRSKAATAPVKAAPSPAAKPAMSAKPVRSRKKVTEPAVIKDSPIITAATPIDTDQMNAMIATAAYYLAAQRNFAPGNEVGDWLTAEQQVLRSLD